MIEKIFALVCAVAMHASANYSLAQRINRQALVQRHNVVNTRADSLSSLTVGNGRFAFTTDISGLQTFVKEYANGVSLGTQSEWGWHNFIDTAGYRREETYKLLHLDGRDISYTMQWNSPARNKRASDWFRQNPHRLQLGNLGFEIHHKDGSSVQLQELRDIHQELNLWTGEIKSHFVVDGAGVDVSTVCDDRDDIIAVHVKSNLLADGQLAIRLLFPYPTGAWTDEGDNYGSPGRHQSKIESVSTQAAEISHRLDTTVYFVTMNWEGKATIKEKQPHSFLLQTSGGQNELNAVVRFSSSREVVPALKYIQVKQHSAAAWKQYWLSGAAIDFSGSTDPRAAELERRVVLSQYLLRAQEAGEFPPQETGLTYNSWFGKPHLEMHWWHAAHYALWGRTELLERSLDWYRKISGQALKIAQRQGFDGYRWPKMTDNAGEESPSSIGALLIWQQPHFIYFAELCYRDKKDPKTLRRYSDLVFKTAEFMASFPTLDSVTHFYNLGKGLIPAQERFKAEETFNPGFELVYWRWGLETAQQWRERLHLPRVAKWDTILAALAPLPVQNHKYLFAESATDSYTNPEYKTDHPAILGAWGMMPATAAIDSSIMRATFDWIWENWTWDKTWGWDFPLTAMTATRLGLPDKAIDALLMDIRTNTYLVNGHNYQDDRLRIYLPGNGGLLTAIAMMCAGYDGAKQPEPGIPKNKGWKIKWEGLKRMP